MYPQREEAQFRGSTTYASVNAHRELDLGRRDDLWSWLYCIVELLDGMHDAPIYDNVAAAEQWTFDRGDKHLLLNNFCAFLSAYAGTLPWRLPQASRGDAEGGGRGDGRDARERISQLKQSCCMNPMQLTRRMQLPGDLF